MHGVKSSHSKWIGRFCQRMSFIYTSCNSIHVMRMRQEESVTCTAQYTEMLIVRSTSTGPNITKLSEYDFMVKPKMLCGNVWTCLVYSSESNPETDPYLWYIPRTQAQFPAIWLAQFVRVRVSEYFTCNLDHLSQSDCWEFGPGLGPGRCSRVSSGGCLRPVQECANFTNDFILNSEFCS